MALTAGLVDQAKPAGAKLAQYDYRSKRMMAMVMSLDKSME